MLEFLQKLGNASGHSLSQMLLFWDEAKRQATKKGLKPGKVPHTQHTISVCKLLAERNAVVSDPLANELKKQKRNK